VDGYRRQWDQRGRRDDADHRPALRVLNFGYDFTQSGGTCPLTTADCYLTTITSALSKAWYVGYVKPPGGATYALEPQVACFQSPDQASYTPIPAGGCAPSSGTPVQWTYTWSQAGSSYTGQISPQVTIVDPRGYASGELSLRLYDDDPNRRRRTRAPHLSAAGRCGGHAALSSACGTQTGTCCVSAAPPPTRSAAATV
jgi:hypothetical protein